MITSVKDTQLRKAAKRRGILLKKSRKGVIDNRGGYMLVDAKNIIIAGEILKEITSFSGFRAINFFTCSPPFY